MIIEYMRIDCKKDIYYCILTIRNIPFQYASPKLLSIASSLGPFSGDENRLPANEISLPSWQTKFLDGLNRWTYKQYINMTLGCGPLPVTVTTRIIAFLIGNPYKPAFATVTGRGPPLKYDHFASPKVARIS